MSLPEWAASDVAGNYSKLGAKFLLRGSPLAIKSRMDSLIVAVSFLVSVALSLVAAHLTMSIVLVTMKRAMVPAVQTAPSPETRSRSNRELDRAWTIARLRAASPRPD